MRTSELVTRIPYEVDLVQHLIAIRCSDSRDAGAIENFITDLLSLEYAARGVKVVLDRQTVAGSVVNRQTYAEIKDTIRKRLRESWAEHGVLIAVDPPKSGQVLHTVTVQISGHTDFSLKSEEQKLVYGPEEVEVHHDSSVNCGMSHATEVWAALRKIIYKEHPEVEFFDKARRERRQIQLSDHSVLHALLRSKYAHDGSVEDFLTSIDVKTQPQKSKGFLRQMLDDDNELAGVPIHINWGLLNYRTGTKVRLDGNEEVHSILDDVASIMRDVMQALPEDHPERVARSRAQKPVCSVVCTPDILSPREMIVKYIRSTNGNHELDVAGSVFLVTGMNVTNPFSTFGPYKLGGLCYSIVNLGIRDFYLVGNTAAEVAAIKCKVENDPILSFVVKKFNVALHTLTLGEIQARGIHPHASSIDAQARDIIMEAVDKRIKNPSMVHPLSPLRGPVKNQEVRRLMAAHGAM